MRFGILKELLILVSIFMLIWAGLAYFEYDTEQESLFISPSREARLSDYIEEYLMKDFDIIQYQKLDSSLQIVTERLLTSLDTPKYDYQFRVIDDDQINAFTMLNGNIFIFSGLIKHVSSAEELALVIAHEIGHAEHRHVVDKLVKTIGIEALFSIITNGDPLLISEISKLTISNSFDRGNEEEADDFALELALKAKINPRRMAQFFLRIKGENQSLLKNKLGLLSTHPLDSERIKKSSDFVLPDDFEEISIPLDWIQIQSMLD